MTTSLEAATESLAPDSGIRAQMMELGKGARSAARLLAKATTREKNAALEAMAAQIEARSADILSANAKDVAQGREKGLAAAFLDRLALDEKRLAAIAQGIRAIAGLPDPVGQTMAQWTRPNGLEIARIRVPLGVVGIIYESRPNVTADAGALCLKSGNAVILRGGSDSYHSSHAIVAALHEGLRAAGFATEAIQMVPTTDRAAVGLMLAGLEGNIDVIVPRGGKGLVARVQKEARVPVFSHLEGICHVYVDRAADADMACAVTVNAKMRRPGICGAAETLLIDRAALEETGRQVVAALLEAGCEVRGDEAVQALDARIVPASEEDWSREYLDAIISARTVEGVEGAIDHIARYGSDHTDSIITQDEATAERFLAEVDSAIVLHNASTQFADGGEFGMGAEIGIATGKMHARGPVGLEQLTSFKYQVRGHGQTRPA